MTYRRSLNNPRAHEQRAAILYLIEGSGRVKVGISRHPKRRLSALQLSTPTPLCLRATFRPTGQSALAVESALNRDLLAPWRIRGEWFSCPIELAKIAAEAVIEDDHRKRAFVRQYVGFAAAEARYNEADDDDDDDFAMFDRLASQLVSSHPDLMRRVRIWNALWQ